MDRRLSKLAVCLALFIFLNCVRDMDRQPSVRPFEETRQIFPENTVPSGEIAVISKDTDYNKLRNPIQSNDATIKKGEIVYGRYCRHCHGKKANGESPVGQSLGVHPENLLSNDIQSKSDGKLFYIITFGEEAMPSLKETVRPDERWLIIHYLRDLNTKSK